MLKSGTAKLIMAIGAMAIIGCVLWLATRPAPFIIQGEISADRYDVSARVSGRVVKLGAKVGDTVKMGGTLVTLESPELIASLQTQEAALLVAKADYERVITVRIEDVATHQADLEAAQADLVLREEELNRKEHLRKTQTGTQAQLDVATRNRDAALKKRDAVRAALDLTKKGASVAARQLAQAKIKQAEAALNSIQSQINELSVISPVSALVTTRVAEIGENFSPGAPLISLVDMNNLWFTFNVREDFLKGVKIDNVYTVRVPALGNQEVKVRVTMMNVLGQFATWRATRATGDFDLRTFEIRAEPVDRVDGLRPGMSAVVHFAAKEH